MKRSIERSVTAALIALCVIAPDQPLAPVAVAGSSEPPPAVGDIGFGGFLDARDFSVSFHSFSEGGAAKAALLSDALPEAWHQATAKASRVRVVDKDADITVLVVTAVGPSTGSGRLVTLLLTGGGLATGEIALLLHELGHALGCCYETTTSGAHWAVCKRGAEIMCQGGPGKVMRFSERELRALRLRSS